MGLLNVTNRKGSESLIIGVSEINQRIRAKLNITCDQYCMLDLIYKCQSKKETLTYEMTFRRLGLSEEETKDQIRVLKDLGFVLKNGNKFEVSQSWISQFEVSVAEFEEFWIYKGKSYWTGSKKDAALKYTEARRFYSKEYLLNQRDGYFKLLELQEFRVIMGASVFLNVKTERFRENFWEQAKRIQQVNGVPETPTKKLTIEEVNEMF